MLGDRNKVTGVGFAVAQTGYILTTIILVARQVDHVVSVGVVCSVTDAIQLSDTLWTM